MVRCPSDDRSWLAVVATLVSLLLPALVLADDRIIALEGEGGEAWSFEKKLGGDLPDGGCDRVVIASPRATVEASQAEGRFGAVVPLLEGDNEVRAICRLGEADRSVSEPQHWRVRLRDTPKAWIRIVPGEGGVALDPGASEPAPGRSAPIVVEAILEGTTDQSLMLERLERPLPACWEEQLGSHCQVSIWARRQ